MLARVQALVAQLNHHSKLYHEQNRSEISDAEYDALYQELEALEAANPGLVQADSPTHRVGGRPMEGQIGRAHV